MKSYKEVMELVNKLSKLSDDWDWDKEGYQLGYSPAYWEIYHELEKAETKIFKCSDCGEMCSYHDLENWVCNFSEEKGIYVCSQCYESEMGDDL